MFPHILERILKKEGIGTDLKKNIKPSRIQVRYLWETRDAAGLSLKSGRVEVPPMTIDDPFGITYW